MRKLRTGSLFLLILFVSSCSTGTLPPPTPELVSVYATYAAEPWLSALYDCAGTSLILSRVDDPAAAAIALRVGEPRVVSSFVYQIGTEEILIVTHRQSPIQNLTMQEAGILFAGQGDPSVQVLVYASDADVQTVFDQFVMAGRVVTSQARLVATPQQMSDLLVNETNRVGILPRHWKAGDVREVLSVGMVPVLALTPTEPQGAVKDLIACMQK